MARFIVTSAASGLEDAEDPDALTLRGALAAAAESAGRDVIRFAADVTRIELHAALSIDDPDAVILMGDRDGDHLPDVAISGQGAVRHLSVSAQSTVTLEGIEFVEGYAKAASIGGDAAGSILNAGALTLVDVRFEENAAYGADGGTGGTGDTGTDRGQAAQGKYASKGGSGGIGGTGGAGGDAAVLLNTGALSLDNVVFADSNAAAPGTGGRGGTGGSGGRGGEGFDGYWKGILYYDPGPGGDGGTGGRGGAQGAHGTGAYGVLNSGGTVEGLAVVGDEIRSLAADAALATAPGGTGGAGGKAGSPQLFGYPSDGSKGANGPSHPSSNGDLTSVGTAGIDPASLTRLDAWFTVSAGARAEIREGQSYTFAVQRHAIDDGIYEVNWEVATNVLTGPEDFKGPLSGSVNFSTTGGDIALVTVTLARDDVLEGPEQVGLRLTAARTLETEERVAAVSSTPAVVDVASELPTNKADVIRGTSGDDDLLLRGGDDKARGRGGDDALKGQGGDDRIRGDAGDDRLSGDGGRDKLWGSAGDDWIDGGKGNDRMSGGGGADVFAVGKGDGKDQIADFRDGQDRIEILKGAGRFGQLDVAQKGDDAVVSFKDVVLTLRDVEASDLDASDFLF